MSPGEVYDFESGAPRAPEAEAADQEDRPAGRSLVVDVDGFEGPLDLLLTLARAQKVDLAKISILELAEQYLAFVEEAKRLELELAADYLVMASWLAFLKSRLLLPPPEEEDEPTAEEMAARLAFRLQRLEAMREAAYSWCKAPRLGGQTFETGALARQIVDAHPLALALASEGGVRARIVGRLLEIARTQIELERMLADIDPGQSFMAKVDVPNTGEGAGLVEAARGALGHWLRIEGGEIANYQIIAPTTWNFSPRDAFGAPGPVEAALEGAPVREGETEPLSVQHIVRSFDPCMVCTVH